ncbi:hypothetical protein [Streptomyces filamentosus]|uniref:hypothetical protein n=1 Tax=Streptomyces filamentosus TaxID=67294 RepID=UPI0037D5D3FC
MRWLGRSTGGRIGLACTVLVHGAVEGAPAGGRSSEPTALHRCLSPPRMVVTGVEVTDDAGTGNSLAALSWVLDVARDREPGQAVALRMTASSWTGQDPEHWLVQHLTAAFGVGSAAAQRLMGTRLVVPVVDGLDELDPPGSPLQAAGWPSRRPRDGGRSQAVDVGRGRSDPSDAERKRLRHLLPAGDGRRVRRRDHRRAIDTPF